MKILVTGGAGFMGSEFVRQGVKRGFEMVTVDKLTYAGDTKRLEEVQDKLTFYHTDILDRDSIEEIFQKEKPKVVVNFAAETHVDRSILDPQPFIHTNVCGTYILLEALRKCNSLTRFIHISTDEVYGELEEGGEFSEETPLKPNSPYSSSKASADLLIRAYWRTYELPVIIVRPSNNYGYWQYPEKLIPVVICKALKDESVPVYGKGLNIREWLYVEDCSEAVFLVLERGEVGEIYNVGSNFEKRNIDVVRSILELLRKPESLIQFVKDRPGHDYRYSMNTDKIRRETGWRATTNFETGIEKTVRWYRANESWLFSKVKEVKEYWEVVYG